MLSRCLARDGVRDGIHVNSICPGYIDIPTMKLVLREPLTPQRSAEKSSTRFHRAAWALRGTSPRGFYSLPTAQSPRLKSIRL